MNDLMNDDDIRHALAPYRQVQASERLRTAVTQPASQTLNQPWARSRPRVAVGGAAAAMLAAALVVLMLVVDRSIPVDRLRPLDLSAAQTVVFADGTTVNVEELFDVANHERLQGLFAEHGAELVIIERPVAPAADGRVYSVLVTAGMSDGTVRGDIHLEAGGRVEVEVGRADPAADTEGLTLYEVFPEIENAVDREDPAATGLALEQLGFQVQWQLIEAPGRGRRVETPPPGTVVTSVLGPDGEWHDIDPSTATLTVEVASLEVAEELGH